ncbi:DEAD-box ATP-dependent RNA helicase 22 [Acorus calamus]|uniref:DEAD-box ATP-dependent RNA helicase 22 n=1 Tax=Acorus calamus TaxID=4465 RepID=A0AAV9EBD0_ACOCL|nr:DEAD-box ATP-dependent RNA helicase 22 [Acorus calamus]
MAIRFAPLLCYSPPAHRILITLSSSFLSRSALPSSLPPPRSFRVLLGPNKASRFGNRRCRALSNTSASDVVVGDDGAGKDSFFAADGVSWTSLGISDRLSRVLLNASLARPSLVQVFDEADLLLCGSFQHQVVRLINMLRYEEKMLSRKAESALDNSTDLTNKPLMDFEHPHEDDEEQQSNHNLEEEDVDVENDHEDFKNEDIKVRTGERRDWRRVREVYTRSKQYIFVAATLPGNGKKTAGGVLRRMFPDASWVSGNFLHCHNPRLEHRWVEVTTETQVDALIDAVKKYVNPKTNDSEVVYRTMVFANTVDAAESVAKILQRVGIECICYHSESSLEVRKKNLIDFREKGGVLVCTDAAARGLDIPHVSHVIQMLK